jgi:hypothetical protein
MLSLKRFSYKRIIIFIVILIPGLTSTLGYVNADTFSAIGKVLDSDSVTSLPGTGLTVLASATQGQSFGYVQCIYAGPDGLIDTPIADGGTTGDDVLLETSEYQGQFFTAVGEGFPFFPQGRFTEDFKYSLSVGNKIYCRAWNKNTPTDSTFYGDSALYTLQNSTFDSNDFGTWSTDTVPISDNDGDGIVNLSDNCPDTPNPGQDDIDNDGIGDACEGSVELDFSALTNGDGSPGSPFNSLANAIAAVDVGGTINIMGGTINTGGLTISKPVIIRSADGFPVIITGQ